ncbi:putative T7SS-secreted protein [Nocardioides massiliensis]|uniref:WXG100 family type VII secretion target n=1 Tax=Nocardioides massiliensis TaxID=1325935 RepID=A0ABT9NQ50_9ACTN|nr:hypothetical protein [Nocardioides massiliensis]MDP9822563.1 hypothetical protein [Nocardioides massiliensis]
MAPTSAADYPNLGFDPTPGDVWAVTQTVRTLRTTAHALTEIRSVLHGAADGEWRGQAAIAFRDLLAEDLRPKIDSAELAFGDAYRALDTWSDDLALFQQRARAVEERARNAQDDIDAASAVLDGLPPEAPPGTPLPEDPAERTRAESDADTRRVQGAALSAARTRLENARDAAEDLQEEYETRARDIAGMLANAIDAAPAEPGWFDRAVEAISGALSALGDLLADLSDAVLDFLHKIAPLLEFIGELTGLLSTILGLLAFIPGLNWLAGPALALAAISFLANYLADAGTTGSWLEPMTTGEFWIGAVSLAIGVGGMALGNHLTAAARLSGNTRQVPQLLIGGTREVPYGFFSIMAGKVPTMETAEFVLRTVNLRGTYWGLGELIIGGGDTAGFAGGLFSGSSYPRRWTNDPVVVR